METQNEDFGAMRNQIIQGQKVNPCFHFGYQIEEMKMLKIDTNKINSLLHTDFFNFPVNGVWGEWGPWASCDAGTKKRNRECKNRLNGGALCDGGSQEAEACLG